MAYIPFDLDPEVFNVLLFSLLSIITKSFQSNPKRDELIAQYTERTKTKTLDILPYKVLAQFRLAVVFQQIFLRYEQSEDRITQDRQFDKLALGLLDFTLSNLVE